MSHIGRFITGRVNDNSAFLVLMVAILCLSGLSVTGCQRGSGPKPELEKDPLTHGQVQLKLKKGVTTQAEVLDAFGPPNIATINETGHEVWSYQRIASVQEEGSSGSGFSILLFGASESESYSSSSTRSTLLIIEFDDSKRVISFRSRSASF